MLLMPLFVMWNVSQASPSSSSSSSSFCWADAKEISCSSASSHKGHVVVFYFLTDFSVPGRPSGGRSFWLESSLTRYNSVTNGQGGLWNKKMGAGPQDLLLSSEEMRKKVYCARIPLLWCDPAAKGTVSSLRVCGTRTPFIQMLRERSMTVRQLLAAPRKNWRRRSKKKSSVVVSSRGTFYFPFFFLFSLAGPPSCCKTSGFVEKGKPS